MNNLILGGGSWNCETCGKTIQGTSIYHECYINLSSYKAYVLKIHPEAICDEFIRLETLYRIKISSGYIGDWTYTEGHAWELAYKELKKKKI